MRRPGIWEARGLRPDPREVVGCDAAVLQSHEMGVQFEARKCSRTSHKGSCHATASRGVKA